MPERDSGTHLMSHSAQNDEPFRHPLASAKPSKHPERYVLGKSHPDRAKQFKPFAALRGYEELIAQVMAEAAEPHDFSDPEEPC